MTDKKYKKKNIPKHAEKIITTIAEKYKNKAIKKKK